MRQRCSTGERTAGRRRVQPVLIVSRIDERQAIIRWRKAWDALADFIAQLNEPSDLDALVAFTKIRDEVAIKWRAVLGTRAAEAGW